MAVTISQTNLQTGLGILQAVLPDAVKVITEYGSNLQDDEILVEDVINALVIAGVLPFYASWIVDGLAAAINNNQSATPGALPHVNGIIKGDPSAEM